VLVYSMFLMTILLAMVSLGVDFGRMQMIKTQLQRDADASARGCMQLYASSTPAVASTWGPAYAASPWNLVDANSGVQPTVTTIWGSWNATTKAFSTSYSGNPTAVRITVSRTVANGNAVPLAFPLLNGTQGLQRSIDVSATAIAVMTTASSTTSTVPGTADVWLAGMPAGSNASWTDTPSNAAPTLALNVTPGQILTFNSSGKTMYNGNNPTIGPNGAGYNTTHMQGSPDGNYNGLQNGIQTLTAPQNSLIGVFLTNAEPDTATPPATALTYSAATENRSSYNSLQVQQPFYIGSGSTSGSVTQTFVVPAGATRFYLGVFDGWQNNDNPGSLTVTTTQQPQV
jgi:hypothetical protein